MTKADQETRDRFAAAALAGLLTDKQLGTGTGSIDDVAKRAFAIADAMMAEKKRTTPPSPPISAGVIDV